MCNISMLTTLEMFHTKSYYNHGVKIWWYLSDQSKTALYIFKRKGFYRYFQQQQNCWRQCSRWPRTYITEHSGTAVNSEGKVKVFPHMPWRHIRRMWTQLHSFLTLTLDAGEWSAWCPSCSTARERAPSTHWTGYTIHNIIYHVLIVKQWRRLGLHLCWTNHTIKYYTRPSIELESI